MKKTRIVLVGALVLALALVMGCKQASSGTAGDWDPNTNSTKTWKKTNTDSEKVLRSFEGFGTTDMNNGVVVKIEVGNTKASKAGILFDYKKNASVEGTVDYYQLGVGTQQYDGKTPEFYLVKISGVKPDDITASTTSDAAGAGKGSEVDIQGNTPFSSLISHDSSIKVTDMYTLDQNGKMTVYVGFETKEVENGKKVMVKIGMYDESAKKWKEGAYAENELKTGKDWGGSTVTTIDGQVCAYGMLTKAPKDGSVSTENTYTIINKTGKMAE